MINPVFCAIDTRDVAKAADLAKKVKGHVGGLKVGLEFFMAKGAEGYKAVADAGVPVFLDVKLHDIPNTVAGAMRSLTALKPAFINVHAAGGAAMMKAAAEAAAEAGADRPKVLAVTVLTSLNPDDMAAVGQATDIQAQALRLATLAKASGLDGVVCSAAEVKLLRRELGPDFILMVPGIRPVWAAANDQKRVMTPTEAMAEGATYLVIGRPITGAEDPAAAAKRIEEELR
jgi:orotidine-5'-phosphate decarboxylase